MSKEEEYRDHALESVELSKKLDSAADRSRLLLLAEAWLDLSEKAAKLARATQERLRGEKTDITKEQNDPDGASK
jgi:hypothetical protein